MTAHPLRRDRLRRLRSINALRQPGRRLQRRGQRRNDLPRKLPDEDGNIFLAKLGNDVVNAVPLDQHRTVRVHIADCAQDTEKVEPDDSLARAQLVDEALEELGFCHADRNAGGNTEDLQEGVKEVLERVGFRLHKATEKGLQGLRLHELVLNPSRLILQPRPQSARSGRDAKGLRTRIEWTPVR